MLKLHRNWETSFSPNLNNKTTSVAIDYKMFTKPYYLIVCSGFLATFGKERGNCSGFLASLGMTPANARKKGRGKSGGGLFGIPTLGTGYRRRHSSSSSAKNARVIPNGAKRNEESQKIAPPNFFITSNYFL